MIPLPPEDVLEKSIFAPLSPFIVILLAFKFTDPDLTVPFINIVSPDFADEIAFSRVVPEDVTVITVPLAVAPVPLPYCPVDVEPFELDPFDVEPFDQPGVEVYKKIVRENLSSK